MAKRATLRASDADREHVAERLRQATAEGRLRPDELEERLETAFSARSYGELDAVVADLPRPPARRRGPQMRPSAVLALAICVAVVVPVMLVLVAALLFVVVPVAITLAFWLAVCWWCFGHRGHHARRRVYSGRRRVYITRL